jgi:branched-chain amino acid transport system substrate-binding protein
MISRTSFVRLVAAAGLTALLTGVSAAQDVVKVGLILPLTGSFSSTGRQIAAAAKLYVQVHGDTVAGKKIELIVKDDTGNFELTRRFAQEMIVNDKASILAGFGYTPAALAAAPLSASAKIPEIIMGAATSSLTEKSPYILRTSYTLAQVAVPAAEYGLRGGAKTAVTLVTDYGPGIDGEAAFKKEFDTHGGKTLDSLRVPIRNADFSPFLQRAHDLNPDVLFVFVTADQGAAFVRQYIERGMNQSKVKLIATGDITNDEVVNTQGDEMLGVITVHHYSAWHKSKENQNFVAAYKKANDNGRPNLMAVGGWDGMALIYKALEKTKGDASGDAFVAAAKGLAWESPRGPVSIDAETRDIIQNIYIRRVEKVDGELYNVEFETTKDVKDPIKAAGKPQ